MKWIIGIDEAGRGPLAGPVTVAAFMAPESMRPKLLKILGRRIRDSKQLSHEQRESIYKIFSQLRKEGKVFFTASHISNRTIDSKGISKSVARGIQRCLTKLGNKTSSIIRLDGLLKAPKEYTNQKTIIKGDEKDVFIACASIVAKVKRDRLMCRISLKLPSYLFEIHKGYGTLIHRKLIRKYGISDLHRASFCGNL